MAKPPDVLLGHEADGIQEFDNPLPAWWLGILWVTIAFTVVFIPYLLVTGWSSAGQYEEEVATAAARYPVSEPAVATGTTTATWEPTQADIDAGAEVFTVRCVVCHGAEAKGIIGPDLTDAEWVHGGTLGAIEAIVTNGVPDKGMIAWGPVLQEEGVRQVTAYVHSLGGGQ